MIVSTRLVKSVGVITRDIVQSMSSWQTAMSSAMRADSGQAGPPTHSLDRVKWMKQIAMNAVISADRRE